MLPMLRDELIEKRGWLTDEELLDYYAIGQATPGIIAINTATFVGYRKRGIPGAVVSTVGMVTPSLIIIMIIAVFLPRFQEIALVQKAFLGIRVAVSVLLVNTLISLVKKGWRSPVEVIISVAAFIAAAVFSFSPVPVIIAGAAVGLIKSTVERKKI